MDLWRVRDYVWLSVVLALATCQTPIPVSQPPTEPTRIVATRWPTHTPTATYTPLPTLTPTATHTPSPTPIPDITWTQLRNLDYFIEWAADGVAEVVDGVYRESAGVDGGQDLVVTVADIVAFGDLNGDRRDDAAILLIAHPGDGSSYTYLTIVSGHGENAEQIATLALGATLPFRSMAIATGRLTLEMLTYKADDARCCPSLDSRRIYELTDAGLTLVTQWDGPRQQSAVPSIPEPARLPFALGTAATRVRGSLYPLGDQRYVLQGEAGQSLDVGVTSPYERVFVSLRGLEDGTVLAGVASEMTWWSGQLPSTQVYEIRLVSVSGSATSYVMSAAVDPPPSTPVPVSPSSTAIGILTPTFAPTAALTLTQTPISTPTAVLTMPDASPVPTRPAVPAGSLVYLTFDSGGEDLGWGEAIVEVLQSNGVSGTFFVPEVAGPESRALARSGHAVGFYANTASTVDQVSRQALIELLSAGDLPAGTSAMRCVRPAYGAMDAYTRAQMAEIGVSVVLWDLSLTVRSVDAEEAAAAFLSRVHPGVVLRFQVAEDGAQIAAVLAEILPVLKEQGYDFGSACHNPSVE